MKYVRTEQARTAGRNGGSSLATRLKTDPQLAERYRRMGEVLGRNRMKMLSPQERSSLSKLANSSRRSSRRVNLVGKTFGRLLVVEFSGNNKWGNATWRCRCHCENEVTVSGKQLTRKDARVTKSCGCITRKHQQPKPGDKYGRLTIIGKGPNAPSGGKRYLCSCACGKTTVAHSSSLIQGTTSSCGCLQREICAGIKLKHGYARIGQRTPEYETWCGMKKRCTNPKSKSWNDYGGRGITVCSRWSGQDGFANFLTDMGPKPKPASIYSLDRKNADGNYEPGNCKWATRDEQASNKRINQKVRDLEKENLHLRARLSTFERADA
jgi:hypothetical protein